MTGFPGSASATGAPRTSVTTWLGVLLVLLFTLNTAGGWVRLSGSGVAIPQWPVIEMAKGEKTLLPPFSEAGWLIVKAHFDADQARLGQRVERGELAPAHLGRRPADLGEFKVMFLTEWTHRLLAAVVGVIAAGCLTIVLRRGDLRQLIGVPLIAACLLIIAQAVIGGALVESGTGTHWLFVHQGNAGLILACVLWSILRLLGQGQPDPSTADRAGRRWLRPLAGAAVIAVWLQLVCGALVAGSRHGDHLLINQPWAVSPWLLWESPRTLSWNLLDNSALHQWIHHWWAVALTALLGALYAVAWHSPVGARARLALQVSASFVVMQIVFGLANVSVGTLPIISLAHQFMGMCLLIVLVLAWFDIRHEPTVWGPGSGRIAGLESDQRSDQSGAAVGTRPGPAQRLDQRGDQTGRSPV